MNVLINCGMENYFFSPLYLTICSLFELLEVYQLQSSDLRLGITSGCILEFCSKCEVSLVIRQVFGIYFLVY